MFVKVSVNIGEFFEKKSSRRRKYVTYKIDTDSRNVTLRKGIVGKSQKKRTFSHAGISDKKKLEKIIAVDVEIMLSKLYNFFFKG